MHPDYAGSAGRGLQQVLRAAVAVDKVAWAHYIVRPKGDEPAKLVRTLVGEPSVDEINHLLRSAEDGFPPWKLSKIDNTTVELKAPRDLTTVQVEKAWARAVAGFLEYAYDGDGEDDGSRAVRPEDRGALKEILRARNYDVVCEPVTTTYCRVRTCIFVVLR